jgi:hypothetical protein
MYKTIEIKSERLIRIMEAYIWEEKWWILTFERIWLLEWGFKIIFNINKIQNPSPGRWKCNSFVDPVLGSLVYQPLRGITLAYDLYLGCTIACWKGIIEKIHFGVSVRAFDYHWGDQSPQKTSFRPSKRPKSLGTEKLLKIVNCPKIVLR